MDGVLSQEEINALLNNNDAADSSDEILTESEKGQLEHLTTCDWRDCQYQYGNSCNHAVFTCK